MESSSPSTIPKRRFSLDNCLWVFGASLMRSNQHQHCLRELAALRERGAQVYIIESTDSEGLEKLRRRLWQTDDHVVMMWLQPSEIAAVRPTLEERKNFSTMQDDWWISPHWFIRNSEFILFRKYNGIAVRLGIEPFVTARPPVFAVPEPFTRYGVTGATLRFPCLLMSPLIEYFQARARSAETINPERMIYFPFSINADSLPLVDEEIKYDFALTGTSYGTWFMRDAFAPFRYSFANLYYDRKALADGMNLHAGTRFKVYDWRRLSPPRAPASWEEYTQVVRQSRYAISTGGLHDASVPKYYEFVCLGTPAIGRTLPYEYPWLDECMLTADITKLSTQELKPVLEKALDIHPQLRQKCLGLREKLFKLYDLHTLLDIVQEQIDGKPVRPGYLRKDLRYVQQQG